MHLKWDPVFCCFVFFGGGGGGEGGVRIISAILSDPDLSLPESRKSAGSLPKWPLVIKSIGREGGGGVSQYHVIRVSGMRNQKIFPCVLQQIS